MVTNTVPKGHPALDLSQLRSKPKRGPRRNLRSLGVKNLSEYLAGGNTCTLMLDASTRFKADSDFDLDGWLAEHQPGVDRLAEFVKANFSCKSVQQEVWLPEITLSDSIWLTGKADVVGFLKDGGIIVGDFKTGTYKSDAHWVQCAVAARSLVKSGKGTHVAAVIRQYKGSEPEVETTIGNILGQSQMNLVKKVLAMLEAGQVDPTATLSNCKFCDFRKCCSEAVLEPEVIESSVEDFFSL